MPVDNAGKSATQPVEKDVPDVKDYAGGWITERKHTNVPAFLRATYIVVSICTLAYLIIYMYGEVNHSERGPLVKQFIQTSQTSPGLMYFVAGITGLFLLSVIVFAFGKTHDD